MRTEDAPEKQLIQEEELAARHPTAQTPRHPCQDLPRWQAHREARRELRTCFDPQQLEP